MNVNSKLAWTLIERAEFQSQTVYTAYFKYNGIYNPVRIDATELYLSEQYLTISNDEESVTVPVGDVININEVRSWV